MPKVNLKGMTTRQRLEVVDRLRAAQRRASQKCSRAYDVGSTEAASAYSAQSTALAMLANSVRVKEWRTAAIRLAMNGGELESLIAKRTAARIKRAAEEA